MFDPGNGVFGYETIPKGLLGGMFRSPEIGTYYTMGHYRYGNEIYMMEASKGRPVVFNLKSEAETQMTCGAITSRVTARSVMITKGKSRKIEKSTVRDRKITVSAILASLALSILISASLISIDSEAGTASIMAVISSFLISHGSDDHLSDLAQLKVFSPG